MEGKAARTVPLYPFELERTESPYLRKRMETEETTGESVPVVGNGDTVETNGDPVGSTGGEREHGLVCTGVSRGG